MLARHVQPRAILCRPLSHHAHTVPPSLALASCNFGSSKCLRYSVAPVGAVIVAVAARPPDGTAQAWATASHRLTVTHGAWPSRRGPAAGVAPHVRRKARQVCRARSGRSAPIGVAALSLVLAPRSGLLQEKIVCTPLSGRQSRATRCSWQRSTPKTSVRPFLTNDLSIASHASQHTAITASARAPLRHSVVSKRGGIAPEC